MVCRGLAQLKDNEKKGISMVVVMCVSAFFIAFATAILYTAGLVTAQSTERLKEERCYQLAKSYAQVVDAELKKYDQKDDVAAQGNIYAFANKFLDGSQYAEYDDGDSDDTEYTYVVTGSDLTNLDQGIKEGYGNLSITLKKEKNENAVLSGEIQQDGNGTYDSEINRLRENSIREYTLTVEVTAYYDNMTYTYSTEYARAEQYEPQFTHNGTAIVWYSRQDGGDDSWHIGNTSGEIYQFTNNDAIQYKYQTGSARTCQYIDTQNEGGTDDGNS